MIPEEHSYVIYEYAAERMFHWMAPFVEKAGYEWTANQYRDSEGNMTSAMKVTIKKV